MAVSHHTKRQSARALLEISNTFVPILCSALCDLVCLVLQEAKKREREEKAVSHGLPHERS
jgi:hypothetical protein